MQWHTCDTWATLGSPSSVAGRSATSGSAAVRSSRPSSGMDCPAISSVQEARNTPGDGAAAVKALMALADPPTAIVASTDLLALGIVHGAAELGLHVPDDLSVVGFDDIPMVAAYLVPALTMVRMPTAAMVAAAIDIAVRRRPGIRGPNRAASRVPAGADHPEVHGTPASLREARLSR